MIVVVEVKARRGDGVRPPEAAVDAAKQKAIMRVTEAYLHERRLMPSPDPVRRRRGPVRAGEPRGRALRERVRLLRLTRRPGSRAGDGPAVLVHGGAWDIPDDELAAHRDGLALRSPHRRQRPRGGRAALDVAVEVVAALEAHPAFDAGRGSGARPRRAGPTRRRRDGRAVAPVGRRRERARPAQPGPRRAARSWTPRARRGCSSGEGAERFAAEVGLPARVAVRRSS